jgi:N-acetylglucosamine kinase-like BadF-type ATPase
MKLFLGIDGGQTAIKSLLADEYGQFLGFGSGGPAMHFEGPEAQREVRASLHHSVREAFQQAGLPTWEPIESVFLGISGVNGPDTKAARTYQQLVGEQLSAASIQVDIDARIALAGAIPAMIGVVVIAGTGSIAFGMNGKGESARAGGWGYLLGDEGGAYEIGRQALVAVGRYYDGLGPETALTPLVLESMNIRGVPEISQAVYQNPRPKLQIAGICTLAAQAARAGDQIANELFEKAGHVLGELACAVARKLGFNDSSVVVSGVGGVFLSAELIWKPYCKEVLKLYPRATIAQPVFAPVVGALLLAYRTAGTEISPKVLDEIGRQSRSGTVLQT